MAEDIRERTTLPLGVPLGIFAAVLVVVFLFSRILLNVPRQVAVAVALMTALNILVTCGIIAMRKVEGSTTFALLLVIAVPVLIGGAIAARVITVKVPPKHVPPPPPLALSAKNLAFNPPNLTLPPGDATIDFKNEDTAAHDVHIFDGPDGNAPSLFAGEIVNPGASATYKVTGLKAGSTYFFRCDVHPTQMTGKVTVAAAATSAAGGGGKVSTGPILLGAANTAFSKSQLDVAANAPIKVILKNSDTAPHNFDIASGPAPYAKPATQPPIAQGGASVTYDIPGLPAGQYEFLCDIHPNSMKGTLTVH
jgi:plastocyanin